MIRRFFTRILMLCLLAFCGYNWWQVQALRADVARLQTQVASRTHGDPSPALPAKTQSWLDRAGLHAQRAREALAKADLPTAQRELDRSLETLRGQAGQVWRKVRPSDSRPETPEH